MLRVLIVDDDQNVLKLFEFAFQKAGFSVRTASNGNKALSLVAQNPPDVVIVDVMMPGLHGYELCRRLRADPRTLGAKIVVLTARSQVIDEQEAMKAGADLFLSKPVLPNELIREINSLLGRQESLHEPEQEIEPEAPTETVSSPPSKGRLIVCFSLSSDVGVTTLSVNLALAFALLLRTKIPLVELHSSSADVLPAMGLEPEDLRGNLGATGKKLSQDTLNLHLVDHSSGVQILPAPPSGSNVPPTLTAQAISLLREQYPMVVVDAASKLDARVQPALLAADLILLIMTPQVPAIRSALRVIKELRTLKFPDRHILLVVNRVDSQEGVPIDRIAEGMKRSILMVIPYEARMAEAFSTGRPLLVSYPRSPAARAMGRMAMQFAEGFHLSAS